MSDYPVDAIAEFLNLQNGLFLVNMSNERIYLNLSFQKYIVSGIVYAGSSMYRIPYILHPASSIFISAFTDCLVQDPHSHRLV